MSVLACLVLTLDLLQTSSGSYAIEDILGLSGSDVAISIALEQPALRTPSEQLLYGLGDLGEKNHRARRFELGIDGGDMQIPFGEIYIFSSDLGHLTHT